MQSKSLLIAIAAFAVTATSVHAYGGNKMLIRAGLSDEQVSAIQEAQELSRVGDFTAARDKLAEAGVTEETLLFIQKEARETREIIRQALEDEDYSAFKEAIADSPLADLITSQDDFVQYCEAHKLRLLGEWSKSREILNELGVDALKPKSQRHLFRSDFLTSLTDEQREAFMVAKQANDRSTMQAILDEAGAGFHHRGVGW
jgi:hypothetical protein